MSDKTPDTLRCRGVVPTELELTLADALARAARELLRELEERPVTNGHPKVQHLTESLEAYAFARVSTTVTGLLVES